MRATMVMLGAVCVAMLLSACTGTDAPSTATESASAPSATGPLPGYQDQTKLEFTPLIITVLEPSVVPVKASDGRYYLAYELSVFNDSARDATLTRLQTLAGDEHGKVVSTLSSDRLAANMMPAGGPTRSASEPSVVPAGRTALIVVRETYPTKKSIPAALTHRISATFSPVKPGDPPIASKFPSAVAQTGGSLRVSSDEPLVIGPPLTGNDWIALNGLESDALNAHSDVIIPVGGRVAAAERYGIDFAVIDRSSLQSYRGDPSVNSSYLAFGRPLIAVADAKVVKTVSNRPDVPPMVLASLETFDDFPGNTVVLDLGGGVYATYAHIEQGSVTVKAGQTVKKGQVIGRLGNSGNTSEAHLHFQLQRGPLITADNVPWVIDRFTADGQLSTDGKKLLRTSTDGPRTNEIPVGYSLSDFPTPKSAK